MAETQCAKCGGFKSSGTVGVLDNSPPAKEETSTGLKVLAGLGVFFAIIGVAGLAGVMVMDKQDRDRRHNPVSQRTRRKKVFKTFRDRSGQYLTLIGTEGGNLILRPTREGIEKAEELLGSGDQGLYEMLDSHLSNGWDLIRPEEIGALTDAPIIAQDVQRDTEGDLVAVDRVYAHMDYAVEDPIEKWAAGKDVFFQGA